MKQRQKRLRQPHKNVQLYWRVVVAFFVVAVTTLAVVAAAAATSTESFSATSTVAATNTATFKGQAFSSISSEDHPTADAPSSCHSNDAQKNIHVVVIGSVNADTFFDVERLPREGENLCTLHEPRTNVPGGKGCTQAVAAAKLLLQQSSSSSRMGPSVAFVGQFGTKNEDDKAATNVLQSTFQEHGVDISHCRVHDDVACGRGHVFVARNSGQVSAVVSGGANEYGWNDEWKRTWLAYQDKGDNALSSDQKSALLRTLLDPLFPPRRRESDATEPIVAVLLQQEVPDFVNHMIATYCRRERNDNCIVMLDVGGHDRAISAELLALCDYVVPNTSELRRLVQRIDDKNKVSNQAATAPNENVDSGGNTDEAIVAMARRLQHFAASTADGGVPNRLNVLVTRGRRGSTLVLHDIANENDGSMGVRVCHVPALDVGLDQVVDETGAGDCYRAAFAVSLLERWQERQTAGPGAIASSSSSSSVHGTSLQLSIAVLRQCMEFASAAGASAVTKHGAVPSTPTRNDVNDLLQRHCGIHHNAHNAQSKSLRGGGGSVDDSANESGNLDGKDDFPFMIGSRLNSMKDRPELWTNGPLLSAKDYVRRQATINGLTCVDFNYPQHFVDWTSRDAKQALDEAGLMAGAVCLRYPAQFARGAMNHPDAHMRRQAIELTKKAAQTALDLGCREVVIWSAYDGYDYPFQVDYDAKWDELVQAFQECCDAYPNVKFSLEYKPTDEHTRFFTVPSTGAALLMVHGVNRDNFGLTLDVGHMLMAGENPAQSIAMVGRSGIGTAGGKLFGIQLNDGYTRLAAEDGLMFGSVHPSMALEIMYQLRRIHFDGHLYFDTFPQRSNPVAEAEYNIRRVKAYWKAAGRIHTSPQLQRIVQEHDAIGALELVNEALRSME